MPSHACLSRRSFALCVLCLPACAGLGGPQVVVIDEAAVQRRVAARFPYERRVLEVLDVRVDTPRVRLLPADNRLAIDFEVTASDRLFGRHAAGRLAIESALRYDAAERAVQLVQVRVLQLGLAGLPPNVQVSVARAGALLVEQVLEGLAVYRFEPAQLERARRAGVQPSAVTVTARGVEITLVTAPR